jgi:pyrrolysine biosynthesis protein PylD
MTRLTQDDIRNIPATLKAYDDTLMSMTGMDLKGIACRAYGLERSVFMDAVSRTRVGIVPITWGQGIIPGFSETVQEIVVHLGFTAYVTRETDVAGLSEAAEKESDAIMLSDDHDFRAIHLKKGISVDNSEATGKVFAAGLDLMAGGLEGKHALVVGCGPVGRQAGIELLHSGAKLSVVDADLDKARGMAQMLTQLLKQNVTVAHDLHRALLQHRYILDASPAAGIVDTQHVAGHTLISAPGVPLCLTPQALTAVSGRLLHDTLQLGVAAMMAAMAKEVVSRK